MRRARVIKKKYDGTLHDEYETGLYFESPEAIVLFSVPGVRHRDHKGTWLAALDGLLEIYFTHRWYNVWHIAEQVTNKNLIYVNIALPANLEGNVVEWVDLDLDFRVHMDRSVELVDQREFEENAHRLGYPSYLVEEILAACREVETGLASGEYPFDHERQVELYWQIRQEAG